MQRRTSRRGGLPDHPAAPGVLDGLGAAVDVQPGDDLTHVVLDGPLGEAELRADFLVGEPLRDEGEDLRLARGEALGGPLLRDLGRSGSPAAGTR